MYPSLVLSAALLTPAAPVPRDAAPNTTGPAPRVLALKADAGGSVRVVGNIPTKVTVTNTYFTVEQVVENGQRVQKQDSTGTIKHVWDGQTILLETDGSNIIQVVYTLEPLIYGNLDSQRRAGATWWRSKPPSMTSTRC